jgi:hypothetical protein
MKHFLQKIKARHKSMCQITIVGRKVTAEKRKEVVWK